MVTLHVKPITYPAGSGNAHSTAFFIYSQLFPILCCVFGLMSLVTGYVIAVLNNHEEAWFSMISEGGSLPPESCIFGILLNFAAFFWLVTCFSLHYHLLDHLYWHCGSRSKLRFLFYFMLFIGILSGLGIAVVADFQLSNLRIVHNNGAMVAFLAGLLYCWCYAVVCVKLGIQWVPKWLIILRIIVVVFVTVCVVMYILCFQFSIFAKKWPDGTRAQKPERPATGIIRLQPCHPYYDNYIIACVSEWLLAVGYFIVIASLSIELGNFELHTLISSQNMEDSSLEDLSITYVTARSQ
ncbi:unnamed protein product [Bursaphelenchus xylophilus]|uniref:(pine wood nematode) hypothetical protein n=1 Tax=Bursaphelenchus xylophilus TaxID=6326 RepID=A0A1I7RQI1_BURXY|nr:unnamed protein product [Bursaphelenchus xylophilus]CAG9104618.1 unnamed protein product [Bursaphelenchus xylophilus]